MQQSPTGQANWFSASQETRNSPHFTEPEGSLPHSQMPAIYACPVSVQVQG